MPERRRVEQRRQGVEAGARLGLLVVEQIAAVVRHVRIISTGA
jgi:hypothetical protein